MKKTLRLLLSGALTAAVLCLGALAAEEQTIGVQLNGEMMTFTDAVPQVREQRTFLPFRAVFEAMGAQVSWSPDAPDTVGASRDGVTVTMTLGSTAATVEEDGVKTTLDMDVAPFAEGGRTYVPVRFAAQAFGCAVGWDQAAYTAIIADTDKLVKEAAQGKSFTYLEKYNAHSKQYSEGLWDYSLTMDGSFSMLGELAPVSVTAQSTTEGETKMEMDMSMKLDMIQMVALLRQIGLIHTPISVEDWVLLETLRTEGIDMNLRGDMATGVMYMKMSGKVLENARIAAAGLRPNTWYSVDMNALQGESGMDTTQLLKESSGGLDYADTAKEFLSTLTLDTASNEGYGTSYEVFKESAENVVLALSDEGFIQDGDVYTASIDGGQKKMELALTMRDGAVTAYDMVMMTMTKTAKGAAVEAVVDTGVDENGQFSGNINMSMGGILSVDLDIAGGYTKGTTAPVTEPPAGAEVVDYMDMMQDAWKTIPTLQ